MTTIVIHGTFAYGGSWYRDSWKGRGFLAGLKRGMIEEGGGDDIWQVNDKPVGSYPELGDVYEWNGLPEGIYRGIAATSLAKYLNTVADLSNEPIRIIAHSHGCNVVKLASSLSSLSPRVAIEQAVFLACPHFYEDQHTQQELSGLDRFDIGKVHRAYKKTGHKFRYRLDPDRFGRILNIYSEKDKVQVDLAKSLSGGQVPLTGSFLENVMAQLSGGTHETPMSSRVEMDKHAVDLYENKEVFVEKGCSGTRAHSVMHGYNIGWKTGLYLNSGMRLDDVVKQYGDFPTLQCDDVGA